MPHDSSTIAIYLKRKLEYKFIYMSGFVHHNVVMKDCIKVSTKQDWKDVMDFLVNDIPNLDNKIENALDESNLLDGFEEIVDDESTNTLVQNILEPKNIVDDDDSIAIAPGENF